jgi:phosphatidylinositol alpha-mannosyltransferase
MKIGFVLDDSLDKTDGVQQYVTTLGKWLSRQGHEVHYLVGHTERRDIKNIHSLSRNLQVHFNQNRMSTPLPASRRKIRELLAQEDFDVLHVQMPYSPFLAGRVVRCAPKTTAIVGTFHILPFSLLESVATRVLAALLRPSRKRFDAVVSVSEPAQTFARKRFKTHSQVVPNVIDHGLFHSAPKLNKYQDGMLNVVYLGRLVERKGCMHLLRAVAHLAERHELQNTRVIIAGKGPLLPELEAYVHAHKLGRVVRFVGYVSEEDKPSLLASAHIAVLPSLGGESFGIVLIEAMAAGAEVVLAGDNAGYRSVMHGHEGQVIDPTDTHAFAKLIKKFLYNPSVRQKAHRWQATRAHEYDVRIVGQTLLGIYKQALRNKSDLR